MMIVWVMLGEHLEAKFRRFSRGSCPENLLQFVDGEGVRVIHFEDASQHEHMLVPLVVRRHGEQVFHAGLRAVSSRRISEQGKGVGYAKRGNLEQFKNSWSASVTVREVSAMWRRVACAVEKWTWSGIPPDIW
jgi:hypothetical protein